MSISLYLNPNINAGRTLFLMALSDRSAKYILQIYSAGGVRPTAESTETEMRSVPLSLLMEIVLIYRVVIPCFDKDNGK